MLNASLSTRTPPRGSLRSLTRGSVRRSRAWCIRADIRGYRVPGARCTSARADCVVVAPDGVAEPFDTVRDRDQARVIQPVREGELVVVHRLSELLKTWHHDRLPTRTERDEDRAHSGMRHEDPAPANQPDEGVERQVRDARRSLGANNRRTVLDDELLRHTRLRDPLEAGGRSGPRQSLR